MQAFPVYGSPPRIVSDFTPLVVVPIASVGRIGVIFSFKLGAADLLGQLPPHNEFLPGFWVAISTIPVKPLHPTRPRHEHSTIGKALHPFPPAYLYDSYPDSITALSQYRIWFFSVSSKHRLLWVSDCIRWIRIPFICQLYSDWHIILPRLDDCIYFSTRLFSALFNSWLWTRGSFYFLLLLLVGQPLITRVI